MAVSLFSTISDFKSIIGGGVNASMELDSIAPYFDIAHERHLEMWLGTDIYDDLVEAVAGTPDDDQEALLPYYRKAVAWLALLEYLPHASLQLSEAGLYRVETDNMKTAYKYQQKAIEDNARTNGYEALEKLLLFLETNKATYTAWAQAPGYEKHHGVLLNTAANFRIVHNKRVTRHVFDLVRGLVEDVECFVAVPLLGQDQYDALLAHRRDDDWTSEPLEKKLIYLLNRVTAHFTLAEALRMNWVQLEGDRVVQREYLEEQGSPKEGSPAALPVGVRINAHDDTGNRYVKKVRDFLTANIADDAFADYVAWQAELAEIAEEEEAARLAAQCATSTSGATCCDESERHDWGTAFGFGSGCTTTRKGAVRL